MEAAKSRGEALDTPKASLRNLPLQHSQHDNENLASSENEGCLPTPKLPKYHP